jgi:serine protease Do
VFALAVTAAPQTKKITKPSPALQTALLVEQATVDAVSRARPAVVSIVVKEKVRTAGSTIIIFDSATGGSRVVQEPERDVFQEASRGSGIIVDGRGYILTNKHVVNFKSALIKVFLANGDIHDGYLVDLDPVNDLAIIKIDGGPYDKAILGDSDTLNIGQTAITIGYSLGRLENTVTSGIVSGIGRVVVADVPGGTPETISDTIQTDAAINRGNSGGPLINLRGEVIGVNTAIEQVGQGIGYAIPINLAKQAVKSAIETGKIIRARLGVRYVMITPQIRDEKALAVKNGALLLKGGGGEGAVMAGGPAEKAGLEENDIIIEVNGLPLNTANSLQNAVSKFNPGAKITLTIIRAGARLKIPVNLDEFPR